MQPLSSMTLRQRCQTIAVQARRMRDAAQAGDWDTLADLGRHYAETIGALEHLPQAAPLDEEDRQACLLQLAEVMAMDQETDRLARQQLKSIHTQLGSTRQSRRLLGSYGQLQATASASAAE